MHLDIVSKPKQFHCTEIALKLQSCQGWQEFSQDIFQSLEIIIELYHNSHFHFSCIHGGLNMRVTSRLIC